MTVPHDAKPKLPLVNYISPLTYPYQISKQVSFHFDSLLVAFEQGGLLHKEKRPLRTFTHLKSVRCYMDYDELLLAEQIDA